MRPRERARVDIAARVLRAVNDYTASPRTVPASLRVNRMCNRTSAKRGTEVAYREDNEENKKTILLNRLQSRDVAEQDLNLCGADTVLQDGVR